MARNRWNSLPRDVFSSVAPKQAAELLQQFDAEIKTVARTFSNRYPSATADADDLRTIGQLAVFEAQKTYDAERGASLESWTKYLIQKRILEEASLPHDRLLSNPDNVYDLHNGATPAEHYERAFARESVGRLDPREAIVLQGRVEGFTCDELGGKLGISKKTVCKCEQRALALLAAWAAQDDSL